MCALVSLLVISGGVLCEDSRTVEGEVLSCILLAAPSSVTYIKIAKALKEFDGEE